MRNMSGVKVIAIVVLLALLLVGCTSCEDAEDFTLIGEGMLVDFQVSSVRWRIGLGDALHIISRDYGLIYESPVRLGEYYYLYQDAVGRWRWNRPYKLTQEPLP